MLEQLNNLADWEYCKLAQQNDDEDFYQFGWKSGIHFYLADYRTVDESGQYFMTVWLNAENILAKPYKTFDEVVCEIKLLIDDK